MSISLKNINNNWKLLSTGNKYYEEELFTKFEDAFLYECGNGKTGIKIIHHARSFVRCTKFSTLPCIKAKDPHCELADIRFLAYSLDNDTARLLFLQFKEGKEDATGHYAKIDEKQMLLFSEFPEVSYYGKGFIPKDVLQDHNHGCPQSGAMFAMIEYDSVCKEYNLRFMNHTMLDPDKPCRSSSTIEKHYYDHPTPPIKPGKASTPAFKYWDYIPSFEDFLNKVKKLEVGREIAIAALSAYMPKEALPVDYIEYCNKNNISITNQINLDNVEGNKSRKLVHPVHTTIALNVDELV